MLLRSHFTISTYSRSEERKGKLRQLEDRVQRIGDKMKEGGKKEQKI